MFKGKPKPQMREAERNNTDGTAAWFKSTQDNKRKQKLRNSIWSTKNTTKALNLYEVVVLPDVTDEDDDFDMDNMSPKEKRMYELQLTNEWVAENLVDFFQELNILYTMFTFKNDEWANLMQSPERLPNRGYPPGVQYKWKVRANDPPEELLVEDYITKVLEWIEGQVCNEDVFPTDASVGFELDFIQKHAKKIFQRMFRVFAILMVNPKLSGVGEGGTETEETRTLLKLFARFAAFAYHWEMVNKRELYVIDEYTEPLVKRYKQARDAYFKDYH